MQAKEIEWKRVAWQAHLKLFGLILAYLSPFYCESERLKETHSKKTCHDEADLSSGAAWTIFFESLAPLFPIQSLESKREWEREIYSSRENRAEDFFSPSRRDDLWCNVPWRERERERERLSSWYLPLRLITLFLSPLVEHPKFG